MKFKLQGSGSFLRARSRCHERGFSCSRDLERKRAAGCAAGCHSFILHRRARRAAGSNFVPARQGASGAAGAWLGPFSSVTSLEMKNPVVICSGGSGAEKLLTPPIHRRWICAVLPGGLCGCLTGRLSTTRPFAHRGGRELGKKVEFLVRDAGGSGGRTVATCLFRRGLWVREEPGMALSFAPTPAAGVRFCPSKCPLVTANNDKPLLLFSLFFLCGSRWYC